MIEVDRRLHQQLKAVIENGVITDQKQQLKNDFEAISVSKPHRCGFSFNKVNIKLKNIIENNNNQA